MECQRKKEMERLKGRPFKNMEQIWGNSSLGMFRSKHSSNPSQFLGHTLCKLFHHSTKLLYSVGTLCVPTLLLAGWEHALHRLPAARATHIM